MLDRLIATLSAVFFVGCMVWLVEAQSVQQAFWAFLCLILSGVGVFSFLDGDNGDRAISGVERISGEGFLAAHCRSTSEHWGGRWSIVIEGPSPQSHDSEDDFYAAIDAAVAKFKRKSA